MNEIRICQIKLTLRSLWNPYFLILLACVITNIMERSTKKNVDREVHPKSKKIMYMATQVAVLLAHWPQPKACTPSLNLIVLLAPMACICAINLTSSYGGQFDDDAKHRFT